MKYVSGNFVKWHEPVLQSNIEGELFKLENLESKLSVNWLTNESRLVQDNYTKPAMEESIWRYIYVKTSGKL